MTLKSEAEAPAVVSLILNIHNEGLLLHRTLISVARAVDHASAHGCKIEVVIVADRLADATRDVLARTELPKNTSVLEVDFGDPGAGRNYGVSVATAEFVAFCDGDDLLAREWLYRAWIEASTTDATDPVAFHPEYIVTFDAETILAQHISSTDLRFDLVTLAERNNWGPVIFARRRLLIDLPFTAASSDGFGFEDWHWLSQLLASGGRVQCIAETVGFMRRKWDGSRLLDQLGSYSLLRPTDLLRPQRVAKELRDDRQPNREQRSTLARSRSLRLALEQEGRRAVLRHPALMPYAEQVRSLLRRIESRQIHGGWLQRPAVDPPLGWLSDVCLEMHELDCAIFPDDSLFNGIRYVPWQGSDFADAFAVLCRAIDREVTHVLLVPWLKRGGADAEVINYTEALEELGYGKSTLVIATEDSPSTWASRLPDSVHFIEFGSIARQLSNDDAMRLLATFLVQTRPQTIHNLNSLLGYGAYQRYGKALSSGSRLFAGVFCEEITANGRTCGYVFEEVPRTAEHLTAILSDNAGVTTRLARHYGIPSEKLVVHRHPVPSAVGSARSSRLNHAGLKVLWAGRLDRQKRPDLLVEIAKRCRDLSMEFHAYGAPVLGSSSDFHLVNESNLTFHGHYEDPTALDWGEYDVFLNTSQYDGLPNVILEAMAAGLPVVTSDIGGIAEAIGPSRAGILVAPFDDVGSYVNALRQLGADSAARSEMGRRGRAYIAEYHSREQFVASVEAVPGYLPKEIEITAN
jgi:glycosyltransferase involved in cell wall biosynthesis